MKIEKVILIECETGEEEQEVMDFIDSYHLPLIWYSSSGWGFDTYVIKKWDEEIETALDKLEKKMNK